MRHLSFRSAAATISGKKKELMAKEEAKYQLAFENEQRSRRELEELHANYDSAVAKEAELISQKSHFKDARHQYESLLKQIFQYEDPNFPMESQLKAELTNYIEQRRLAKRDRDRFVNAERALSTTLVDTKKVIRLLDTVINYVPFEIFGGPIIDEEQVAYLEASKRRIWEIQRLLNSVRTTLPEIPYPQTLDVVTNNTLLSMQFNTNYIDIAWKAKSSQCFGILATAYRNIQNSLTWVKQYKEYAVGAISRLETAVNVTKKSLEAERKRIMDTVLEGYVDPSASSSTAAAPHNLFDTPNNDLPPPVYEAPPSMNTRENSQRQEQHSLPIIPDNLTPISRLSEVSINTMDDANGLLSTTSISANNNNNNITAPPQPITPVINSDNVLANNNNNNTPTYISHNVNNPFVQ
ncbi:uncharacterized protein BX663DRAFT_494133 [Cokeromyces recurvatus]|uniref:uncharacterized protein n=1 Tax=Cokeromyces recurvatus TaxID=90255 RepID=UPI00221E5DF6|nr:uncharacterized protein BX663DRAFT_494133 [Cokeromyces recurvatus]KAI7906900.1 hypothetical protein BX663DRAFT_494133 [Cokeromyces recurvatus]